MNYSVDLLFLFDIIVNFNLATYNEDMEVVENRIEIAKNYLQGWFAIDLVAIIPFDLMAATGESSRLVRMSRLGRIYKIFKLVKLVRLFKLKKSNTAAYFEGFEKIMKATQQFRWFFRFFFFFIVLTHLTACMWIIVAKFDDDDNSWLAGRNETGRELYLTSFYFSIATIMTNNYYGDISADTFSEKITCIIMMCSGLVVVSFSTGALTNFIA